MIRSHLSLLSSRLNKLSDFRYLSYGFQSKSFNNFMALLRTLSSSLISYINIRWCKATHTTSSGASLQPDTVLNHPPVPLLGEISFVRSCSAVIPIRRSVPAKLSIKVLSSFIKMGEESDPPATPPVCLTGLLLFEQTSGKLPCGKH